MTPNCICHLGHLEGEQPQLGDILSMVMSQLRFLGKSSKYSALQAPFPYVLSLLCFHGFGPGVLVWFSHRFKINNSKELHKPSSWLNFQKTKFVECKGCKIRVLRHHGGTVDGQKPSTKWES